MECEISFGLGITLTLMWEAEPPPEVDAGYRTASGTLEISLEPVGGFVQGRREVAVDAQTLEDFHDTLAQLVDSLTGSVTLEPTLGLGGHGNFAITVTLHHGKGHIQGFLATHYHQTRLTFAGYETDQSFLQQTRRQLGLLLSQR